MNIIWLMIGATFALFAYRLWRSREGHWLMRVLRRSMASGMMLMALPIVSLNGYQSAMAFRPQPQPITDEALFQGISYTRAVRTEPRPLVIHVLEIDLTDPNIRLYVTPPDAGLPPPGEIRAQTTTAFLRESEAQVAINAGFFGTAEGVLPGRNDPVDMAGLAISDGVLYSRDQRGFRAVYFSSDNRVNFNTPVGYYNNAVAGYYWFLRNGGLWTPEYGRHTLYHTEAPRTVVASDAAGETLLLIVVDGRQPGYSEGVSIVEMAAIAAEYGAYNALNLDGGGSATMAANDGRVRLLNSPVHRGLPGWERPVGNHIAVYAAPLD